MISEKMNKVISEQVNKELYSAYLYVGMAAYAASLSLNGIANWFKVQAGEEVSHATKFMNYVNEQGGKIALRAIDAPDQKFTSVAQLFEKTLAHEKEVTASINGLVSLAQKEGDNATEIFLQWFVTEQVEEEANPTEILQKLEIGGKSGSSILILDGILAGRK
ncbi:MAG TPA: ferritin [Candidatus Omnitrophota bacterium]|nr:ferritin [Candidatus Omnitrophota bacterium]HPS36858.1 ferritin [Candidatus Omnitrophota bacterium]